MVTKAERSDESGRGQPRSKTLSRNRAGHSIRQVLECGCPPPIFPPFVVGRARLSSARRNVTRSRDLWDSRRAEDRRALPTSFKEVTVRPSWARFFSSFGFRVSGFLLVFGVWSLEF